MQFNLISKAQDEMDATLWRKLIYCHIAIFAVLAVALTFIFLK